MIRRALVNGWIAAAAIALILPGAAGAGPQLPTEAALPVPAVLPAPAPAPTGLARDAREYARQIGVSQEEAVRRLQALEETVAATDRIAATYRDRLAGLWIEHVPAFRIVVLLTGDTPVATEALVTRDMVVPVVYQTGGAATREQLIAAISARQGEIRAALPSVRGIGADPKSGQLALMVRAEDAAFTDLEALSAEATAIAGVPAHVRVLTRTDGNFRLDGGSRVEGTADGPAGAPRTFVCTAAFAVSDGVRSGLTTAAHCPDTLSHVGPDGVRTPLRFVGQWGAGYQDVQVNVADLPFDPAFRADPDGPPRPLTGWRNRASTRVGDFVCHRGERTGYSCAQVELVDFAPPAPLCAGECNPVWVAVAGPSCRYGDSGGPVFLGGTAFGILKGGSYEVSGTCSFYYYMSVDYLPQGWSLIRG